MFNDVLVVGEYDRLLYVDIDKTLVAPFKLAAEAFEYEGETVEIGDITYKVLSENVYMVQRFAASDGVGVVFWSAGGAEWAIQVTSALGISELAHAFLSKPSWYLDDLSDAGFAGHGDKFIDATKVAPSFK